MMRTNLSPMVVFLILGALISCAFVEARAQVNFSPTWGKRASEINLQSRDSSDHNTFPTTEDCKLPFEGVVRVLRLIQMEAQRLIRCEHLPGDVAK